MRQEPLQSQPNTSRRLVLLEQYPRDNYLIITMLLQQLTVRCLKNEVRFIVNHELIR